MLQRVAVGCVDRAGQEYQRVGLAAPAEPVAAPAEGPKIAVAVAGA